MIPTKKNIEKVASGQLSLLIRAMGLDENRGRMLGRIRRLELAVNSNADVIEDLNAKFDAINKHYGISVEKQEAQYVVKEGE